MNNNTVFEDSFLQTSVIRFIKALAITFVHTIMCLYVEIAFSYEMIKVTRKSIGYAPPLATRLANKERSVTTGYKSISKVLTSHKGQLL